MPVRRIISLEYAAAVVLIIVCAAVVQTRSHTPTGSPPAAAPPAVFARLIRAGSTLYWTVNQGPEHSVYAMIPPGHPRLLYREHGDVVFGALATLPQLVVVVDDLAIGSSRIQRLPLQPGSPARTLASTRRLEPGDLLADNSRLIWADDQGLQAVPTAGGPVRTLIRDDDVRDLAAAGGRLFYVSGRTVKSIALIGGAPTTEARAANNITALCVSDRIYWSELGVTVQSPGQTHWIGRGGHYTTDIACAGSRLVWSDCPSSHTDCHIVVQHDGTIGGFNVGPEPRDLNDNGTTTAYLNADGPNVRVVDPAWTYRPGLLPPVAAGRREISANRNRCFRRCPGPQFGLARLPGRSTAGDPWWPIPSPGRLGDHAVRRAAADRAGVPTPHRRHTCTVAAAQSADEDSRPSLATYRKPSPKRGADDVESVRWNTSWRRPTILRMALFGS